VLQREYKYNAAQGEKYRLRYRGEKRDIARRRKRQMNHGTEEDTDKLRYRGGHG
jgi:hypothetical protein